MNSLKVAIIGCGKVGSTAAFAMLLDGYVDEIVLHSRSVDKAMGEKLDLEHGLAFLNNTRITATEDFKDVAGSQVVVVTAGVSQKPGDTRLDLTSKNKAILDQVIPQIVKHAPQAVILIVTNPVDVLTYHAYKLAGLPKGRVFGSGTVLDSARFRFHLSEMLQIKPSSIHAYILGEHGDHSFPVLSSATIGGQPLTSLPDFTPEKAERAYLKARDAAYEIIKYKGSTYYAIGVVINYIVKAIAKDSKSVMPVSIPLHQYNDQNGIALSVPCIVGRNGVERVLEIKLSWDEKQKFARAAETLKEFI
jgi:L-lactate dehydrogenase